MSARNARFWVMHRDTWVKLTLRPGQSVTVASASPDEEGYSYSSDTYTHEGATVRNAWSNGGRDCDGCIDRSGVSVCALDQLQARDLGADRELCGTLLSGVPFLLPKWEREGNERIYDQYAQAAGY